MGGGWNRASIRLWSRPTKVERDVIAADLYVPGAGSHLVLLGACAACGAMAATLSWFGLTLIVLAADHIGGWFWWIELAVFLVATASLFGYASWERRGEAEWLERF